MRLLKKILFLTLVLANTGVLANIDDDIDQDDGTMGSEFPHIPEPMVFDLVRPLGVKRGELEMNTLSQYQIAGGHVEWAPEIEYAILDGLAVELELPFNNTTLEDYKFAIQGTLTDHDPHFAHGWQLIGKYLRHEEHFSADFLYISGYRFGSRWATLNMFGLRGNELGERNKLLGLVNLNLFYNVNDNLAFGIEMNNEMDTHKWNLQLTPQMHINFTDRLSLQVGLGYQKIQHHSGKGVVNGRLIYTF